MAITVKYKKLSSDVTAENFIKTDFQNFLTEEERSYIGNEGVLQKFLIFLDAEVQSRETNGSNRTYLHNLTEKLLRDKASREDKSYDDIKFKTSALGLVNLQDDKLIDFVVDTYIKWQKNTEEKLANAGKTPRTCNGVEVFKKLGNMENCNYLSLYAVAHSSRKYGKDYDFNVGLKDENTCWYLTMTTPSIDGTSSTVNSFPYYSAQIIESMYKEELKDGTFKGTLLDYVALLYTDYLATKEGESRKCLNVYVIPDKQIKFGVLVEEKNVAYRPFLHWISEEDCMDLSLFSQAENFYLSGLWLYVTYCLFSTYTDKTAEMTGEAIEKYLKGIGGIWFAFSRNSYTTPYSMIAKLKRDSVSDLRIGMEALLGFQALDNMGFLAKRSDSTQIRRTQKTPDWVLKELTENGNTELWTTILKLAKHTEELHTSLVVTLLANKQTLQTLRPLLEQYAEDKEKFMSGWLTSLRNYYIGYTLTDPMKDYLVSTPIGKDLYMLSESNTDKKTLDDFTCIYDSTDAIIQDNIFATTLRVYKSRKSFDNLVLSRANLNGVELCYYLNTASARYNTNNPLKIVNISTNRDFKIVCFNDTVELNGKEIKIQDFLKRYCELFNETTLDFDKLTDANFEFMDVSELDSNYEFATNINSTLGGSSFLNSSDWLLKERDFILSAFQGMQSGVLFSRFRTALDTDKVDNSRRVHWELDYKNNKDFEPVFSTRFRNFAPVSGQTLTLNDLSRLKIFMILYNEAEDSYFGIGNCPPVRLNIENGKIVSGTITSVMSDCRLLPDDIIDSLSKDKNSMYRANCNSIASREIEDILLDKLQALPTNTEEDSTVEDSSYFYDHLPSILLDGELYNEIREKNSNSDLCDMDWLRLNLWYYWATGNIALGVLSLSALKQPIDKLFKIMSRYTGINVSSKENKDRHIFYAGNMSLTN